MTETLGRPIPAPKPTPETEPFWAAAKDGRFLIKRCEACGQPHWYPRTICPFCMSARTVWEQSPGEGVIYTFSIMRRAPTGPFAIGYVTLDEGPSMLTNFVGFSAEELAIGKRVKVRFQETEDGPPVPVFAPA